MTRTSHPAHVASAVRSAVRGVDVRAGEERAAMGPLVALVLALFVVRFALGVRSRALLPDLVLPRPSAA